MCHEIPVPRGSCYSDKQSVAWGLAGLIIMRKGKKELEKVQGTAADETKMIWETGEGTDLFILEEIRLVPGGNI